jgi:osmotically-inducible protein OsmY
MTLIAHKTDHELKTAITDELTWASDVGTDHIGVAVTDGAVTLSGQVHSYPEKEAAVHAALRIHGVVAIADEIVVQHAWSERTDADVASEATTAFERSSVVPQGSVKATVRNHIISLSGSVPWNYQRTEAARIVSTLPGVHGVHNLLTLTPPVQVSAAITKNQITAALVRNAGLDAQHVHVAVNGSVITLSGTVQTMTERREAERAAWFAPGATRVDNELLVSWSS